MSFPKHAAYSDSGVDWLGEVPGHWALKRLKYVASLLTDKGNERENAIGLENIEGWTGRFIPTDAEFEGAGVDFDAGDVLFGKLRPYLAKVWLAEFEGEAVGDFHVMRPAGDICGRYLVYQMLNRDFISIADGSTFGAKMPRVSWDFMANMLMPVPPPDEQKAISSFLDVETSKIDGLVSEQRRLIELLKEKRQAVISHAVTKGLNPNAPMKPSGIQWLGDVPQHWSVVRMRRVGEIGQGCAFSHSIQGQESGDLPWFKVKDMNRPGNEIEMRTADNYVSAELAEEIRATIFPADTVIFPRVGAALLTNKRRILVTRSITDDNVYGFIPTNIHPRFLYLLLLLVDMERLCSPGLVPTVTFSVIKDLYIPLPPPKEQNIIVETVETQLEALVQLQAEAEQAIKLLQERRTALISAAVTGKIDVRESANEEAV